MRPPDDTLLRTVHEHSQPSVTTALAKHQYLTNLNVHQTNTAPKPWNNDRPSNAPFTI